MCTAIKPLFFCISSFIVPIHFAAKEKNMKTNNGNEKYPPVTYCPLSEGCETISLE
jgi:hypothetical protein